jgi:L-lactate dehydrogenase complex protein LldG
MSAARDEILGRIRAALRHGAGENVAQRLEDHPRGPIPARAGDLDQRGRIALFVAMAEEVAAPVTRVANADSVPAAVTRYLAQHNLPARAVLTPDPLVGALPWDETLIDLRRGVAAADDAVGISACFAAVAETGTLVLLSGPDSPTRNSFLPDTHIVVLRADRVVGFYEEAWDRLRATRPTASGVAMPRTVNLITGPSRTADIAQTLELGMHGPRRLHIVLIDDGA